MGAIKFDCVLCKTEFDADEYDNTGLNECPNCGQIHDYQEGRREAPQRTTERCHQSTRMNSDK